jgi:hypothetical protein
VSRDGHRATAAPHVAEAQRALSRTFGGAAHDESCRIVVETACVKAIEAALKKVPPPPPREAVDPGDRPTRRVRALRREGPR